MSLVPESKGQGLKPLYLLVGNSGWWEGVLPRDFLFPTQFLGFPAQGITPPGSQSQPLKSPSGVKPGWMLSVAPSVWISSVQLPSGPDRNMAAGDHTLSPGSGQHPEAKPSLANGTRARSWKRAPLQWEEDRAPTALTSKACWLNLSKCLSIS